ncbi:MAG: radical SAM protein [Chloroflexi bacterium]|nr:radical SAM protein [Chloroflexota bacterium]
MAAVRPYRSLRMVLTVCGRCFSEDPDRPIDYERDILQGELIEADGRVLLRRHCRRGHGEVVSLYEEDSALWAGFQEWRTPTRTLVPDRPGDVRPIPMGYADGLGELQGQHTCILLVDVTESCDLRCPTCFAMSGPEVDRFAPRAAVEQAVDAALRREGGHLDVVMLSGGEPTVHPEFEAILDAVTARDVTRVIVNTNGLRIARDDRLVAQLTRLRRRIEVYLQFDGLDRATSLHHRGADLTGVKARALDRLTAGHVFTTLACTVAAGVNDGEVGAVLDLALATPYVGGVVFQPVFTSGRSHELDPLARATTTGVVRRLTAQSGAQLTADDFIALPCSHPDCSAITYLVQLDDGTWRSLPALLGRDRLRASLPLFGNRVVPDDGLTTTLSGLLSSAALVSRPETITWAAEALQSSCSLGVGAFLRVLDRVPGRRGAVVERAALRVKRIQVKGFMDAWTMNVERLRGCCVHVASIEAGGPSIRVPLCAREAFGSLRRRTSAGMTSRAAVTPPGA